MIFVAMKEDALVFIESPTYYDATKFAPIELEAGEDPVVVEPAILDDKIKPDVKLRWFGHDGSSSNPRHLRVGRTARQGVIAWRRLAADRKIRDQVIAREDRPAVDVVDTSRRVRIEDCVLAETAEAKAIDLADREIATLHTNLGATQDRCTSLLNEARFARRERDAWFEVVLRLIGLSETHRRSRIGQVLEDVLKERARQDAKWGVIGAKVAPQNALAVPFGTGLDGSREAANEAKAACDSAFKAGQGTWAHVLQEELAEVLAETDPVKLRNELVQLGAVCVKCVEILDWKAGE